MFCGGAEIYAAALAAIEDYIRDNEWKQGGIYYGEMLQDGTFDIAGTEKPDWEDGNWGERANL